MFCKKCGSQIGTDMSFCTTCGAPVAVQRSPMQTAQPQVAANHQPTVPTAPPVQQVSQKKAPPVEYTQTFTKVNKPAPKQPAKEPPKEYLDDPRDANVNSNYFGMGQQSNNSNVGLGINNINTPTDAAGGTRVLQPVQNSGVQPPQQKNIAQKKTKKKNIGLRIVAIILVLAVVAGGGLFLIDGIVHKNQMEGKKYISEFPVLKLETEFTVYDEKEFPVDEYNIRVEKLNGGSILKSEAFVDKDEPVVNENCMDRIYNIKFPKNGNYRITLTEINSSRTNTLPSAENTTIATTSANAAVEDESAEAVIVIVIDVKVDDEDPNAQDKVNINSKPGEIIAAPPEEETTVATSGEVVKATEADFRVFENMVDEMMPYAIPEFDCKNSSTEFVLKNFVTYPIGMPPGYTYYFNDGTMNYSSETPDPKNKWNYAYYTMKEENVKWICETIFHVDYDPSFSLDSMYVDNGYIYKDMPDAGDIGYSSVKVASYTRNGNGYDIIIEATLEDESVENFKFNADLQNIDGNKRWTIYTITKSGSTVTQEPAEPTIEATNEDFNDLADILLALNFTEYDSSTATTAFVVESMLTNDTDSWGYDQFFGDVVKNPSSADPRNQFGTDYRAMNSSNVQWICENVLNVKFDPAYSSAKSYVENGMVYRKSLTASEGMNYFSSLSTAEFRDGKYEIVGQYYSAPIGQTTINENAQLLGEYVVTAELKMIDGQKIWSIYSIRQK